MQVQKPANGTKVGGLLRVRVRCEGLTPLLMNRMSEEELEKLRIKDRKTVRANMPKDKREQASPKVYENEAGPYLPLKNLFSCLVAAGQFFRLDGKRQMTTAKSSLLPGVITIEQVTIPLYDPRTKKPALWEVDMQQGRNPNGGEAVCIVRPRFDVWAFTFDMTIDTSQIDEDRIRALVDLAGSRVGLGDFRPQRKGYFGRWVVQEWKHL